MEERKLTPTDWMRKGCAFKRLVIIFPKDVDVDKPVTLYEMWEIVFRSEKRK